MHFVSCCCILGACLVRGKPIRNECLVLVTEDISQANKALNKALNELNDALTKALIELKKALDEPNSIANKGHQELNWALKRALKVALHKVKKALNMLYSTL